MADVFLSPLELITWEDLLVFLAFDRPLGERPTETARLDFKRELNPADVARTIAEMANTDGGLILVGVVEDKASSRPAGLHQDAHLGKKPEDSVNQSLSARVEPRPQIQMQVREGEYEGASYRLMIIRVAAGDDPPYCDSEHGVRLRPGAISISATRREIEQLFRRGGAQKKTAPVAIDINRATRTVEALEESGTAPANYLRLIAAPTLPLEVRLDAALERQFHSTMRIGRYGEHRYQSGAIGIVDEHLYRDLNRVTGRRVLAVGSAKLHPAAFSLERDARVELAIDTHLYLTSASERRPPGAPIWCLAYDLNAFLQAAHHLLEAFGNRRGIAIAALLISGNILFRPWHTREHGGLDGWQPEAVPEVGEPKGLGMPTIYEHRPEELAEPDERARIVADVLADQLRAAQHALVDHGIFLSCIRKQLGLPT